MFKKLFLLVLVIAPVMSFAQEKIAYLNAQEIMSIMPESKQAQAKIEAKVKLMEQQAKAIADKYTQTAEKFRNDTTEVTEAILMDRQTELSQLEQRYNTFIESNREALDKERQALLTPIQQKLMNAIKAVGDENGYTYILDGGSLVYVGNAGIDAGPKVKAKLGITK